MKLHMHSNRISMARPAFTLVELLVVIAIIGVLVGLLLPAVQAARASARRTRCANCVRQVAIGVIQYAEAHRGRFPSRTHTENASRYLHWIQEIAPFTESVDAIRRCPDDPLGQLRMTGLPNSGIAFADPNHSDVEKRFTPQTSYVANGYLSFDDSVPNSTSINNLNKILARSKTVMLFEKFSDPAAITSQTAQLKDLLSTHFDHTHSTEWFRRYPSRKDLVLSAIRGDVDLVRHAGASHFAYADGHVEVIDEPQVIQWIDTGFDFAKPTN
jgi:prepilin-type N-terminal cleavage/methylation domain-containing protein/prepilin-type processing-associated H-X9-DG protein